MQIKVGEVYGRKITPRLRKGTPLHLYLPGPHRGIWNLEALNEPEIILCEAPFDALTLWVNGFRNVTFIYGTEGFTGELFEAILSHHVRRVRLAYDSDEAGNRAASRDAERLMAHGLECFRVRFPWGMDANDYARKTPEPVKALQGLLSAAEWLDVGIKKRPPADPLPSTPQSVVSSPEPLAGPPAVVFYSDPAPASFSLAANNNPLAAKENIRLERVGEYQVLRLGNREYRVGGLEKNNSLGE